MKLTVLKNNVPTDEVLVETPNISEKYEIFVGRSEDCHVRVDDPLISRHQFVLKNIDSSWTCQKLTQLGTVTVNGQSQNPMKIQNGDEIKCGAYSFVVSDLPNTFGSSRSDNYGSSSSSSSSTSPQAQIYIPTPEPVRVMPDLEPLDDLEPVSMDSVSLDDDEDLGGGSDVSLEVSSTDANEGSSSGLSMESFEKDESSFKELGEDSGSVSLDSPSTEGSNEFGGDLSLDEPQAETQDVNATETYTESDSPDDSSNTRVFKSFVKYQLILFGQHAPYDRFSIEGDEVFFGRDAKKCQIILNDPEVSSVHAVLRKSSSEITLEDLNSSNGTILNGSRINKATVVPGDEFLIGGTSFKLEVKSDLLDAESDRLMPVEKNQFIEREEIEEVDIPMDDDDLNFSADAPKEKSIIKRILKDPVQRKKALYAIVAATIMLVLFYEPEEELPSQKKVAKEKAVPQQKAKIKLTKELETRRNVAYELGVDFFEQNKYSEALQQFQVVTEIDPDYKKVQTYLEQTKVGLKRIEELETQRRTEEDRIKTKKLIEELLVKARAAVKEKQVQVAENLFSQITEKDPENIEVQQLKLELEAWQKEQERAALEKATKEAARKAQVDAFTPSKTFYLKKEWYRAILKLEEFLRRKGTDEDLVKEASDMLSDAKDQLASELGPLLGKARSLKEGQDLKAAYEAFLEVLRVEPTNAEALNEVDNIKNQLEARSKRVYREAIIAESLSLFNDAKEKFQEVQQISPTDSEYYNKASEKLKDYLE